MRVGGMKILRKAVGKCDHIIKYMERNFHLALDNISLEKALSQSGNSKRSSMRVSYTIETG